MSIHDICYWPSLEDLSAASEDQTGPDQEFHEPLPIGPGAHDVTHSTRRDFLKLMGFSLAAASLAACETPIRKAIPYLNKPEEIDPGIANYYATSYQSGSTSCGLIVKTREGRPIKIEGNPQDQLSGGGVDAQIEASILGLYDTYRYKAPQKEKSPISWTALDQEIRAMLSDLSERKLPVYLITRSVTSPSARATIAALVSRYPNVQHISYDNPSYSAALDAYRSAFGRRMLPFYDFSKARAIVSLSADFLGSYLAPTLFSRQFAETRKVRSNYREMSRLFVMESNLSLTGANADYRETIGAGAEFAYLSQIYNGIAARVGAVKVGGPSSLQSELIDDVIDALWAARGSSLILCGQNSFTEQRLCIAINHLLGNYGSTLRWDTPFYMASGDDQSFYKAYANIRRGLAGGVIFHDCNPVYEHPEGEALADVLSRVPLTVSTSVAPNETTECVKYVAPTHHYLEAWGDAEPIHGLYHLRQPTITPLFDTRQVEESFLRWSGSEEDYFSFLKNYWKEKIYVADEDTSLDFQRFFDVCLHDGVYLSQKRREESVAPIYEETISGLSFPSHEEEGLRLVPYFSVALGNGEQAGNPWLQELPDPITKVCWENVLSVSPSDAQRLGIYTQENEASWVRLKVGERSWELPAIAQPGQALGTLGLALGYGRRVSNRVARAAGIDIYPLLGHDTQQYISYRIQGTASVEVIGRKKVAMMQTQHTHMGRQTVLQEARLSEYQENERAGRYHPKISTSKGLKSPGTISLWEGHSYANHHWGMSIDLNSCTGCNACVVACQAENNIPVVGKEEVIRRREMHWLRIDRYYSSQGDPRDKSIEGLAKLEKAADNPQVTFQPMLCQHCNNAPCETVCPVAATTHSSEGINQMTYNRCVGTRYCANNCPYKVRRFNWFKYHDNDQFDVNTPMYEDLGKMVLNPDVTVRSRGVMEKCTFCIQRIQGAKLQSKLEERRPRDEEVRPACAAACTTGAIVFGDLKDSKSDIHNQLKLQATDSEVEVTEGRAYQVLEELNVKPNIWYLTKIRNQKQHTSAPV